MADKRGETMEEDEVDICMKRSRQRQTDTGTRL